MYQVYFKLENQLYNPSDQSEDNKVLGLRARQLTRIYRIR
jgi:hypothetical protein